MKKIILLIAITLGVVACDKQDDQEFTSTSANTAEEFVINDGAYVLEGTQSISVNSEIGVAEALLLSVQEDLSSVQALGALASEETLANAQSVVSAAQSELSSARQDYAAQLTAVINDLGAVSVGIVSLELNKYYTLISPDLNGIIINYSAEKKSGFVNYGFNWSNNAVVINQ